MAFNNILAQAHSLKCHVKPPNNTFSINLYSQIENFDIIYTMKKFWASNSSKIFDQLCFGQKIQDHEKFFIKMSMSCTDISTYAIHAKKPGMHWRDTLRIWGVEKDIREGGDWLRKFVNIKNIYFRFIQNELLLKKWKMISKYNYKIWTKAISLF